MNKTEPVMVGSINYEAPVMVAREVEWLRDEVRKLQARISELENHLPLTALTR